MSVEIIVTYLTAIYLLIGSVFVAVGVIGLLKFNDPMTRLHAPTKVGTVGIGSLLFASIGHSFLQGETSIHELLIMAFLFVTAPISANFIAKVNIHNGTCEIPSEPLKNANCSTLNISEDEQPEARS